MRKGEWTQTVVFDALKLAGALALFGSPWLFQLPPGAKWNLWICGYFVVVASLAALLAEADWEPEVNLCIGAWLLIAPWVLGFSHDLAASLLHLLGGSLVSILSALTWYADRSPPWQFRPGAALRAQSFAGLSVAVGSDLPSLGVVAAGRAIPPFARPPRTRNPRRTKLLRTFGLGSQRGCRFRIRSGGALGTYPRKASCQESTATLRSRDDGYAEAAAVRRKLLADLSGQREVRSSPRQPMLGH
jgi:SPW repeat